MADFASNLDLISSSQQSPEVTANEMFNAGSPATHFGYRPRTSSGLTWGYYGGVFSVGGIPTQIADGTLTLSASATNYIQQNPTTGAVSTNTSAFTAGYIRLYTVVTGTNAPTDWDDWRMANLTPLVAINAQTGTSYTIDDSDHGKIVTCSNAAAITVTVPSGLPIGFACEVIQIGAGTVTFSASGTTINSAGALLSIGAQHAAAALVSYTSNVFNLSGNLA
jgi:hypothetical protein